MAVVYLFFDFLSITPKFAILKSKFPFIFLLFIAKNMFFSAKLFFHDWFIALPLFIATIVEIAMWWLAIVTKAHFGLDQAILHYNVVFGVDWVGPWLHLLYIPSFGLFLLLCNFVAGFLLFTHNRFMARTAAVLTVLFELLLLTGLISILNLNV